MARCASPTIATRRIMHILHSGLVSFFRISVPRRAAISHGKSVPQVHGRVPFVGSAANVHTSALSADMGPHAHVNRSHDAALHRLAQARSLEDGVPQLPDGRGSPSSGNASKLHSPANETGHIDVAQASKPISTSAVATAIPKKHSEPDMLASQGGSMEMLNRPKINGFSDQDHGGLPRYHTSTTHHPVHHPEGPPPVTLTQGVEPYKPGAAAMDGTLVTDMFSPAEVYDLLVEAGAKKAKKAWPNAFMLGIMAGLYIGIGSMLAVTVGGAVPELKEDNPGLAKFVLGFIGLPFGLFMVVVTGADLFTGNSAMTFAAFLARKISVLVSRSAMPRLPATPDPVLIDLLSLPQSSSVHVAVRCAPLQDMLWAWGMSWFANFVGSLVVVGLVMAAETHEHHEGAISIAEHKCENPFG